MSKDVIRAMDMRLIDDLFGMGGGYVLDFSDRTFGEFFAEELGIPIDEATYSAEGTSKAKRLRYLLKISDKATRLHVLSALWGYRMAQQRRNRAEEGIPGAELEFQRLVQRIGGGVPSNRGIDTARPEATPAADQSRLWALKPQLTNLSNLKPQPRGYAFERFLKDVFDINGLSGRSSFRLVGEQIDGSFELSGETYLLEARWADLLTGVADLHAFHGKLEEKAAWTRGLFVSYSGFSEDGLIAFGRGKRVVCMDGLDLHDMLDRTLMFNDVVAKKVRRMAETGNPFVRVRDLFI